MTNSPVGAEELPVYQVRAVNTSPDSENRIHDDEVATKHGFRGGLVPGVTIYGYMTVPLVEQFSLDWLARGSMQIRFHKPFYEGDPVVVRSVVDRGSSPIKVSITAEHEDGTVCATGLATVADDSRWLGDLGPDELCEADLPAPELRPVATRDSLNPGMVLGVFVEGFDSSAGELARLRAVGEKLPIYFGLEAVAHPSFLLGLSNQLLMRNFKLGPWIHTASDVINLGIVRDGNELSVRGRVAECYERKGHEFVVLDVLIVTEGAEPVQQVRHTAIYQLRQE